ncbi:MAG: glycosyltransferase [Candidatus Aminicenantes bacterium]|nr:glycosyltransferase [Candidatus Aminicenantes bacterium]
MKLSSSNNSQSRRKREALSSSVCYVFPQYDAHDHQHFIHIARLLEEIGKHTKVYAIIERCSSPPIIQHAAQVYCQIYGRRNKLFRAFELVRMASKIYQKGCRKFFIRISTFAGITLGLLSKIIGIKIYFWHSGQAKNVVPPWGKSMANILNRWNWELREFAVYLASKFADYFVTGPESMGSYYIKNYKVNPKKLIILYNDIDIKRLEEIKGRFTKATLREQLGLPPNKLIALFVGRVSPLKGGSYLLPLAKKLFQEVNNTVIVVVGEVFLEGFLQEAQAQDLKGRFLVKGSVPNQEVIKYYLASDLFIMPSNEQGFPRVLLEAMAAGLPVVAFDVGGVRDIISKQQLEYLVPGGSIQSFVERTLKLLRNGKERKVLSQAGLEQVEKFSTEKVAKMFLDRIVTS